MRIKRALALIAASLACLCLGGTAAEAAAPASGSGAFEITFVPNSVETAGGNTFMTFTFVENFSGFLAGTRVGQGELVVHPDGNLTATGSGVFTGTIAGSAPGTVMFKDEVSGSFSASSARVQSGDGTSGLSGIVAEVFASGHAVGTTSLAGTYVGRAQFANA